MKRHEYEQLQQQIVTLGGIVEEWDLDAFVATIERAETVGPIVDPSLWRRGSRRIEKIRKLAAAYIQVQKAFRELRDLVAEEEAAIAEDRMRAT